MATPGETTSTNLMRAIWIPSLILALLVTAVTVSSQQPASSDGAARAGRRLRGAGAADLEGVMLCLS